MKQERSFWLTPAGFAAAGLIGVALYFLLMEHREHVVSYLPYLLVLACPLMHLFMHGSHRKHHEKNADNTHDNSLSPDYQRGYDEAIKKERSEHSHH